MYPNTPGPARAHGQSLFLGRQVMFGLEKLVLVHFDAWKCYVLLILIKENIPGANYLRCQIVRGVKLSVFTHGVKLSAVSNCPGVKLSGVKLSAVSNCPVSNCPRCQIVRQHCRCQIVRGVKLSWCQIVLESQFALWTPSKTLLIILQANAISITLPITLCLLPSLSNLNFLTYFYISQEEKKNDLRNSGGTLWQKFNLNDI